MTAEVVALAVLLAASKIMPAGLLFGLYVLAAQLLASYLVHCPAHYVVGTLMGIRFRRIRLGLTSLVRALPPTLGRAVRLMPVLTLSTEKDSVSQAPRKGASAMYAAGTVASAGSVLMIAAAATLVEPLTYSALAWIVAVGYLLFDIVFSPKSGDLMRARRALRPSPTVTPRPAQGPPFARAAYYSVSARQS